jgi:hypothetical protein
MWLIGVADAGIIGRTFFGSPNFPEVMEHLGFSACA